MYKAGCSEEGPGVGVSSDEGLTWTWRTLADKPGALALGNAYLNIFVGAATDAAGNVFVAWAERVDGGGTNLMLTHSTDEGATWSRPARVNAGNGTYVFPWITAGKAGHVAVAAYGTRAVAEPERVVGDWYAVVALAEDALAAEPAWHEAAASDQPVSYGPICVGGNGCVNGRHLGDFFQLQADGEGWLHVAYNEGMTGDRLDTRVVYARQLAGAGLGGPSVEKNGGS
jgi:hypothetical protein